MRQDLHLVTRIRGLDIAGQRKLNSRGSVRDPEAIPTRQSMRSAVPHYSHLTVQRLAPAKRWLSKQAGRPWNSVYSELRERFDPRNTQQMCVLESLLKQVDREVYLQGDEPRVQGTYGSWAVGGLYVHPHSGLLLDAAKNSANGYKRMLRMRREKDRAEIAKKRVIVSDSLQLHLVEGQWYWVEIADIVEPKRIVYKPVISRVTGEVLSEAWSRVDYSSVCRDVLSGRSYEAVPTRRWETDAQVAAYGRPAVYAKRKWQASRKDVSRYVKSTA